jgi:hypothetical protein
MRPRPLTMRPGLLGCAPRLILCLVLAALATFPAAAQIQQAWVAHYNNGITNGTNQAVKMALDSAGNIYLTGFSQNTNGNLGYVTIKYAPNGTQLWAARYDSTNYPTATPAGLALDSSNNVVVTGNALTIKYDANGNQLWTAPYNGAAVAIDNGGNSIVTGYGAGFNTVKISPSGSNLWSRSYVSSYGPAASQAVVVDSGGNAYVAGWDTYICLSEGPATECYNWLLTTKYDPSGNQLWINIPDTGEGMRVSGMAIDADANFYVIGNGYLQPYLTYGYTPNGVEIWAASDPSEYFGSVVLGVAVDATGNTFVTGGLGTGEISTIGAYVWTNYYYLFPVTGGAGTSIVVDRLDNAYATGFSPGTNSGNDIVTIKYGPGGNQIWLQRYNGPGNGNDAANAVLVDNGNVYVTGYETLPGGGTGIVTIKYSPFVIQRRADGTVLLEAQGSSGESFDIQASADLLNWSDLGSVLADTNGLMQFDDTNAPNYPTRFYYTKPQ